MPANRSKCSYFDPLANPGITAYNCMPWKMPKIVRRNFRQQQKPAAPAAVPPPPESTRPRSAGFDPIIIDLSQDPGKSRRSLWPQWTLLLAASFFAAGGLAFLILGMRPELAASNAGEPPPFFIAAGDESPSLPPLPEKEIRPPEVNLVPILKKLPVAKPILVPARLPPVVKTARAEPVAVHVESNDREIRAARLARDAAEAAHTGRGEEAIRLYGDALHLNPQNRSALYNLVGLLLRKAGLLDQRESYGEAAALYRRALTLWNEDDSLASAIRARLEWIESRRVDFGGDFDFGQGALISSSIAAMPAAPYIVVEEEDAGIAASALAPAAAKEEDMSFVIEAPDSPQNSRELYSAFNRKTSAARAIIDRLSGLERQRGEAEEE